MTVNELIRRLEQYRDEDGDTEVRLMTQQNWPFENTIYGVTSRKEFQSIQEPDEDQEGADEKQVIFICEGRQLDYGSKRAWDSAY